MTTPSSVTDDAASDARWPPLSSRALRWVAALDRQIERLDHRDQARFMSITNALELQFEAGATPSVVRLLLRALLAAAKDSLVAPTALGIDDDPDRIYDKIAPRRRGRGLR
jgi:hypothetical protein